MKTYCPCGCDNPKNRQEAVDYIEASIKYLTETLKVGSRKDAVNRILRMHNTSSLAVVERNWNFPAGSLAYLSVSH